MNKIKCLAIIFLVSNMAWADGPLQSVLEQYVVEKNDQGEERFRPAEEEEPGVIIEYRLTLTHTGECKQEDTSTCALDGVVPALPVPVGTEYVADSAASAEAAQLQVSIDNGATWEVEPVTRMVVDEKGNQQEVVVPATEYTNVHWLVTEPVLPAQTRNYSYRVRVK